eukprot:scaffold231877_cov22-Tisochrysis_lutea.AAC.1
MRHGKNRSLASRKREKNVSGATLESAFSHDPRQVEPYKASWETAVPRSMRLMMHAAKMAEGTHKRVSRHREDTGERRPTKKQREAEGNYTDTSADAVGKNGEGRKSTKPAGGKPQKKLYGQQAIDPEASLPRLQQRHSQASTVTQTQPHRKPSARKQARTVAAQTKARFGEVNDAPPELQIGGVLAKKAAAQKAAASAAADQLARQRALVIDNYKAARLKRQRGN